MYTGTLIEDLFEAVERAEKAAARWPDSFRRIETDSSGSLHEDALLVGAGAQQSRKFNSEAE